MKQERIKRSINRYIKIEKLSHRRHHLNDLNLIIKILYPYRQTINKYHNLLAQTSFTDEQKKLIIQTAHSLTIINELYRDQDTLRRLYVTREDIFNAIYMLQNELDLSTQHYLLSPSLRWFYKTIQPDFCDTPFTAKQICRHLDKSKTTVHRYLSELTDREFLKIIGKQHNAYLYKIIQEL